MGADPIAVAVPRAVTLIERQLGVGTGSLEGDFRNALALALQQNRSLVSTEVRIDCRPFWRCKTAGSLGGFDLATADVDGRVERIIEMKWCTSMKTLRWVLWDVLKAAGARTAHPDLLGVYLAVAAPSALWGSKASATNILNSATLRWPQVLADRALDWAECLAGNTGARPVELPEQIYIGLLAEGRFHVGEAEWALRVAVIETKGNLAKISEAEAAG